MAAETAASRGAGGVVVALTTVESMPQAEALARALVEERLVACVNVVPGIRSFYRWQGEVEDAGEILLVVKTTSEAYPSMSDRLLQLHPYDVPELVRLEVAAVAESYARWLLESVGAGS